MRTAARRARPRAGGARMGANGGAHVPNPDAMPACRAPVPDLRRGPACRPRGSTGRTGASMAAAQPAIYLGGRAAPAYRWHLAFRSGLQARRMVRTHIARPALPLPGRRGWLAQPGSAKPEVHAPGPPGPPDGSRFTIPVRSCHARPRHARPCHACPCHARPRQACRHPARRRHARISAVRPAGRGRSAAGSPATERPDAVAPAASGPAAARPDTSRPDAAGGTRSEDPYAASPGNRRAGGRRPPPAPRPGRNLGGDAAVARPRAVPSVTSGVI